MEVSPEQIFDWFKLTGEECYYSYFLASKGKGEADLQSTQWQSYVSLDMKARGLVVSYHNALQDPSIKGHTIELFLRVKSVRGDETSKQININFEFATKSKEYCETQRVFLNNDVKMEFNLTKDDQREI